MKSVMYLFMALLLLGGVLSTQANVKDDGLILYFSFDNENGGKIKDETGGGHDAEIIAKAEITTGEKKYGRAALEIRDPNADVQVRSFKELETYQDNSFLFWLNFIAGHNTAWSQIIAKKAPGSDRSPGIWICPNSLNIHWRFHEGNKGTQCAGPGGEDTLFELNTWYHVAGVKKGGTLAYYVNGKKLGDDYDVPAEHQQGAGILYIGKTSAYRAATFYIDELYVYDKALSGGEVVDVMKGGLLPVEPKDKLAIKWGQLKTRRD